jgi:hypothetical protein
MASNYGNNAGGISIVMCREVVVDDFEVVPAHFPGDTGEKYKISQCSRHWGRDEGRTT